MKVPTHCRAEVCVENSGGAVGTVPPSVGEESRRWRRSGRIVPPHCGAEPSLQNASLTLLGRASSGSSEAWQQLDSLYRPFIAQWFRRQNILPADADDLTQDVLAVLVRDLTKFDHNGRTGAFRAWVRGVCLNRAKG